jgi:hypothetical protein
MEKNIFNSQQLQIHKWKTSLFLSLTNDLPVIFLMHTLMSEIMYLHLFKVRLCFLQDGIIKQLTSPWFTFAFKSVALELNISAIAYCRHFTLQTPVFQQHFHLTIPYLPTYTSHNKFQSALLVEHIIYCVCCFYRNKI